MDSIFVLADHCKNTQGFRKCLIFSEFDFLPSRLDESLNTPEAWRIQSGGKYK